MILHSKPYWRCRKHGFQSLIIICDVERHKVTYDETLQKHKIERLIGLTSQYLLSKENEVPIMLNDHSYFNCIIKDIMINCLHNITRGIHSDG